VGHASQLPDVPGLGYVPEYVSLDEERELLAAVGRQNWKTDWERRRQIYGLSYGSAHGEARVLGPLPAWIVPLAERVVRDGYLDAPVANVVVNEYLPGQGIGPHRDFPGFGPTVVALSLGSAYVLDLVDPSGRRETLDLGPRSLWILAGEARTTWMHGIKARKTDVVDGIKRPRGRRVSITMRTAAR
jgi:alkylated DNA repair dioxygenase AlkB